MVDASSNVRFAGLATIQSAGAATYWAKPPPLDLAEHLVAHAVAGDVAAHGDDDTGDVGARDGAVRAAQPQRGPGEHRQARREVPVERVHRGGTHLDEDVGRSDLGDGDLRHAEHLLGAAVAVVRRGAHGRGDAPSRGAAAWASVVVVSVMVVSLTA